MNDRENEIYKRGAEEVKNTYAFIHDEEFSCGEMADMFLKGAQYADQHPRKGLWDANKVLAWISQNIESYCKLNAKNFNNLLFDLRKAMEG